MDADNQQNQGGQGDATDTRPAVSRSDAKLIERAIAHRWPISDEVRRALATKVAATALKAQDPRAVAALSRVVVAMEAQNQADDHANEKNARIDGGKATDAIIVIKDESE